MCFQMVSIHGIYNLENAGRKLKPYHLISESVFICSSKNVFHHWLRAKRGTICLNKFCSIFWYYFLHWSSSCVACWICLWRKWPTFIMPPTLEKLKGHIAFALSVRPSVRPLQNLLRYSFEILYMDSSKNNWVVYFSVWIIPLCGVMPLLKGHTKLL